MISVFVFVLLIAELFSVESSIQLKIGVNKHVDRSREWRTTVDEQELSDSLECMACNTALSATMFILVRDSVKQSIMKRLEFACNQTEVTRDACLTAMHEVLDFVFDTLKNMSGRDVCAVLDYCPDPPTIDWCVYQTHQISRQYSGSVLDYCPDPPTIDFCPFCLQMVDHVEQIILSDAFLNELHGVVLGLCDTTTIVTDLCYTVMDGLFNNAVDTVKTEFDAKHVCAGANLCPPC
ncbi:hypothetical protein EG68_11570 [Paragonimus skrjabini miyazakii]|uniref:Saposin B-type domain-containing protein n=1 Tax=Paragonimus skrjabini miyazakii TaxID=59628 RepID=A0A8S9Y8S4_9TREM|nr:hypothetical protein EG68_11570 [Paragonimus skrjabini miyazakii]